MRRAPVRLPNVVSRQLRTLDDLPMFQRISAELEQGWETGEGDGTTACPEQLTGFYCIAKIAAQHGLDLTVEQLRHAYPVDNVPISKTLLLRIAKEAGL